MYVYYISMYVYCMQYMYSLHTNIQTTEHIVPFIHK